MKHKRLKPQDVTRWKLVKETTERYAFEFGLRLEKVSPAPYTKDYGGMCYFDGEIEISLRWKDGSARPHYYVLDTIAHELAHLAHLDHRREWALLFTRIFSRMAKEGRLEKFRKVWKRSKN